MGGYTVIFILKNLFLFTFIFWALTLCTRYFFNNSIHKYKLTFYECGFKSINKITIHISFNCLLILLFLLLYDLEFLLFFPFVANIFSISLFSFIIFLICVFFIIISLYIDYELSSLNWQI